MWQFFQKIFSNSNNIWMIFGKYAVFAKYAAVGVVNTLFTFSIIFILMYCGVPPLRANPIAYAAAFILSFILNSLFTFTTRLHFRKFIKFLLTCLFCYAVNFLVIKRILTHFPEMKILSQVVGMVFYTVSSFIINKLWAMK